MAYYLLRNSKQRTAVARQWELAHINEYRVIKQPPTALLRLGANCRNYFELNVS